MRRTTTIRPPLRPRVVCAKYTWRTVEVGVKTFARFLTRPVTRRCRVIFKMKGCGQVRFRCTKFRVPYTSGDTQYPACSHLDFLKVSVPKGKPGKRFRNSIGPPDITAKEDIKVVYRAGPPMKKQKGVRCSLRCLQ